MEKHEDSDDNENEEVHEHSTMPMKLTTNLKMRMKLPRQVRGDNSSGESEIENNMILARVANILTIPRHMFENDSFDVFDSVEKFTRSQKTIFTGKVK